MGFESISNAEAGTLGLELKCSLSSNNLVEFLISKTCQSPVVIDELRVCAYRDEIAVDQVVDNTYVGKFTLVDSDLEERRVLFALEAKANDSHFYAGALFLTVMPDSKGSLVIVEDAEIVNVEDMNNLTLEGSAKKVNFTGGDSNAARLKGGDINIKSAQKFKKSEESIYIELRKGNPVSSSSIETSSAPSSPKNAPIVALVCEGGQEFPLRIFRQPELKIGKGTDRIGQDVKQPDVPLCLLVRDQVNQPSAVITQTLYDQYRKWFETLHFTLYKKGDFIYLKLITSNGDIYVSLNGNEPILLNYVKGRGFSEPLKITGVNNPSVVSVSSDGSQKPLVFKLWVELAWGGTCVRLKPEGEFAFLGDILWLPDGDLQRSIEFKLGNQSEFKYEPKTGYHIDLNGTYTAINKPFTRIG